MHIEENYVYEKLFKTYNITKGILLMQKFWKYQ